MRNTCHGGALRTKLTPWKILILPLGKYKLLWLVIKRTHLESINCCESGSTANGLGRTLCISVATFSFVVLSLASPPMGMSLPLLLEMFLVAIVAFQGEGYSWVRHTSWKLKRHAVRSCDILRPENFQCDNFKYKLPTLNNHKEFLFRMSVAHLVLILSTGFAFIPFNRQKKLRNLQLDHKLSRDKRMIWHATMHAFSNWQ